MANLKDLIVNGVANFIGRVYAQTPTTGTSDRQVATTEFVQENLKTKVTNCILEAPNGVMVLASDNINFTLKQGLKVLIPNGRNADGTLKNIEIVLNDDNTYSQLSSSSSNDTYYTFVDGQGIAHATTVYQSGMYEDIDDSIVANQAILYFAMDTNKTYLWKQSATSWTEVSWAYVGTLLKTDTTNTVQPEQPLNLLKLSDLNNIVKIKQTYINGASGYRIWSNGYCEQWGKAKTTSVTYLKKFLNTDYNLQMTYNTGGNKYGYDHPATMTVSGFTVNSDFYSAGGMWKACGFLAADQY